VTLESWEQGTGFVQCVVVTLEARSKAQALTQVCLFVSYVRLVHVWEGTVLGAAFGDPQGWEQGTGFDANLIFVTLKIRCKAQA